MAAPFLLLPRAALSCWMASLVQDTAWTPSLLKNTLPPKSGVFVEVLTSHCSIPLTLLTELGQPTRSLGLEHAEVSSGPWRPLTFSPAWLTVSEGANATFTCSFSNWSEDLMLNWYRLSPSNQTEKQAAFYNGVSQPVRDNRFQITQLPNGHDFHMNILTAQRNDSGIYLCGAISLPPKTQIKESPGAELVVTERILETSTRYPSPSPRPAGQFQGLVIGIMSILVGVPVLLLLAWVLVAFCSTGVSEARRTGRKEQPLKEDPSAAPVFSVAYEELDFQGRQKTPELPTPCVHTEYATIVFTEGLGASSLGRRGSADGPQGPRPPRHEDGHCSWPL